MRELILLAVASACFGCSDQRGDPATTTPTTTAAPGATTTPGPAVKETMQALAKDITRLQQVTGNASLDDEGRSAATTILTRLEKRIEDLQAGGAAQGHPLIGARGLGDLLGDVELARVALRQTPPDPAPARNLSASCRGCHGIASVAVPNKPQLPA